MDVILLSDVEKLGLKGDVVDVKRGYARNYLLPRRLAEVATPGRVAEIRRVEAEKARHEARSAEQAEEIAALLTRTVLRFVVKAGPTGSLFGSITPSNIAEEIWRTRKVRVDKRKIELDAIKRIGRHFVTVNVYEDVSARVKTLVVPEGGELTDEELEAITIREEEEAAQAEAAAAAVAEAEAAAAEAERRAEAEARAAARARAEAEAEAEAEAQAGAEPEAAAGDGAEAAPSGTSGSDDEPTQSA